MARRHPLPCKPSRDAHLRPLDRAPDYAAPAFARVGPPLPASGRAQFSLHVRLTIWGCLRISRNFGNKDDFGPGPCRDPDTLCPCAVDRRPCAGCPRGPLAERRDDLLLYRLPLGCVGPVARNARSQGARNRGRQIRRRIIVSQPSRMNKERDEAIHLPWLLLRYHISYYIKCFFATKTDTVGFSRTLVIT